MTVEIQISKFCWLPVVFGDLPRLPVVILHNKVATIFDAVATKSNSFQYRLPCNAQVYYWLLVVSLHFQQP